MPFLSDMMKSSNLCPYNSPVDDGTPSAPPDSYNFNVMDLMGSGQLVPSLEPQTEQYGKVKMDNCQETVLGTKIMADNVNIIVSSDKGSKLHQNIKKWGKSDVEETGLTADERRDRGCCWRRMLCVGIGIATILVAGLIIWLVFRPKSGGAVIVTTTINTLAPVIISTTTTTITPRPTIPDPTPFTTNTIPPTTQPTTNPTESPPPAGKLVSRDEWKGKKPKVMYLRANGISVNHIALDSFGGSHCSTISTCSALLQAVERESGESLNYDFLIDDSGNTYEARGWEYLSDWKYNVDEYPRVLADETVKVAFIGNYDSLPLTSSQIQSFISLILHNAKVENPTLETQAYRGIPGGNGPSKNVYCGIQSVSNLSVKFDPSTQSGC